MSVYFMRRNKTSKQLRDKEADTKMCPSCSADAVRHEVGRDSVSYKCDNCGSINIYTLTPAEAKKAGNINRTTKSKNNKYSSLTVRDKSMVTIKNDQMEGAPKPPVESTEVKEDTKKTPEDINEDDSTEATGVVEGIRSSMRDKKVVSFNYISASGSKSTRAVEPYKIEKNKKGEIVLWAWCQEKEGIRQFKLNGISSFSSQPYNYEPKWPIEDKLGK